MTKKSLNKYFDHTLLKPEATPNQVADLCKEAIDEDFFSVCINSYYVPQVAKALSGSDVKTCAVIGFPLGACSTASKVFETKDACDHGASEIDMVINVGLLKAKEYTLVRDDIAQVVSAAKEGGAIVKVILETCLLDDEEIVKACELSMDAKAAFVKTSTGFNSGGATTHHVALMRKTVGDSMEVKASGGIRDYETAKAMIEAGADRIGASAGVQIMKDAEGR